jgi:hypothetical protein
VSTILEDELREALRARTADIAAPPGLLGDVRRGAARRRTRTRLAVVAVPAAVAAAVAAGALAVPRLGTDRAELADAADEALLSRPTTGGLAGDRAYLDEVRRVFLADGQFMDYRSESLPSPPPGAQRVGQPRVLWAATVPSGRAAVVAQRERVGSRTAVAVGYVSTSQAGSSVTTVARRAPGYTDFAGAFVGADRRVLLVLDRGEPLTWSYGHTYLPGGGIKLTDRPVTFAGGVAVLTVPPGVDPGEVELTRPGAPDPSRVLPVGNDADQLADGERLPWYGDKRDSDGSVFEVGAGARAWPDPAGDRYGQLKDSLRRAIDGVPSDRYLYGSAGDDGWYAYGGTPDGQRLVATDMAALADPSRAYVVLLARSGLATVVDGGPVDRRSSLPIQVRLPDRQGWLVAAKGTQLAWRTGSGAWTSAGRNAALLPAAATEVQVNGQVLPLK